jgi:hypothetical protein
MQLPVDERDEYHYAIAFSVEEKLNDAYSLE